jgi:uncharacterized protein DUF6570
MNVSLCQEYPPALEDLTFVEECLIARCHPLGFIIKLRPGGRPASVNYYALKGHMIVLPQDPVLFSLSFSARISGLTGKGLG